MNVENGGVTQIEPLRVEHGTFTVQCRVTARRQGLNEEGDLHKDI